MQDVSAVSVLIVEPNSLERSALMTALSQDSRPVAAVEDGSSAISFALSDRPTLVLLECDLPDRSRTGFDICRLLVDEELTEVVVMTSTRPTREMVLTALRSGALEFLVKPASSDALRSRLEAAYRRVAPKSSAAPAQAPLIDFGKTPISTPEKVDVVMKRATTIRALPHAVVKIIQLAGADDSAAADLAKAAESDPSIAAMLMKRASSAFYSRGRPVTGISQAVVRLGFTECKSLVIGLSVFKLFSQDDRTFGFSRAGFWLHSIACGLIATRIANRAAIENAEDAMTLGLLHDIGKIVLDDLLSEEFQVAVRRAGMDGITLFDAEIATFQRSHVDVGSAVVEKWRFPSIVRDAIRCHHNHSAFLNGTSQKPTLSGAVYLANQIAKAMLVGEAGDFIVRDISPDTWSAYGFGTPLTEEFIDKLYGQIEDFCTFLELKPQDLGDAMARRSGLGAGAIVHADGGPEHLLTLFLMNQGYRVEVVKEAAALFNRVEPFKLCLLRPASSTDAQQAIARIESGAQANLPTVCILPEGTSAEELGPEKSWLKAVPTPIDCFRLLGHIREFEKVASEATAAVPT